MVMMVLVFLSTRSETEKKSKAIVKLFKGYGLPIVVDGGFKRVDFLHVTFDLEKNLYKPYPKPNNSPIPIYVSRNPNHPLKCFKTATEIIAKGTSETSCSEKIFSKSMKIYSKALKESGFTNNHQMKHVNLRITKKGNAKG